MGQTAVVLAVDVAVVLTVTRIIKARDHRTGSSHSVYAVLTPFFLPDYISASRVRAHSSCLESIYYKILRTQAVKQSKPKPKQPQFIKG